MNAVKAVFLDRDGVINADPGVEYYVKRLSDFALLPGVTQAVRSLKQGGFKVFVVSNQSGIRRGAVEPQALRKITARMRSEFKKAGASLDCVEYCVHDDEDKCDCRKPKEGLYRNAVKGMALDKSRSFCVGDTERDIESGKRFGIASLLVLSGKSKSQDVGKFQTKPDAVFKDLKGAAAWILKKNAS